MRKMMLIACLVLSTCGGSGLTETTDAMCSVVPIATVQGCTSQPLPLTAFAYPVDASALTLYLDGVPLPASAWELTNQGHTVTLNASACVPGNSAQLVSASLGCAVAHADCTADYGCR
jgi:hypothetical protein